MLKTFFSLILLLTIIADNDNAGICNLTDQFAIPDEIALKYARKIQTPEELDQYNRLSSEDQALESLASFYKDGKGNIVVVSSSVYIFRANNIPYLLIDSFKGLGVGEYVIKNRKMSRNFIQKGILRGHPIDSKLISTEKGIKLGMPSAEVVKIYGPSQSKEIISNNPQVIRFKWENYGQGELETFTKASVKGGYFYDAQGRQTVQQRGVFCSGMDEGRTIYIDFLKGLKTDEAVFIYIDRHYML